MVVCRLLKHEIMIRGKGGTQDVPSWFSNCYITTGLLQDAKLKCTVPGGVEKQRPLTSQDIHAIACSDYLKFRSTA